MPSTSAIFLDVANTLLYKPALYPAIGRVLDDACVHVPLDILAERHRLLSEATVFPDRTSRAFYDACSYLPWAPFPDVACLESLTHPLGALSNWDRSLPEKLRPLTGLTFRWILGSEEQQIRKPDPKFFERILEATGSPADEVVYVGDSVMLDVEPAQRMGMRAYLIDRDDLYRYGNLPRLRSFAELEMVL